jgi:hypothetical protein
MHDVGARHTFWIVVVAALFMTSVLLLDREGPAQLAFGLATAAFVWLLVRRTGIDGRQVLCAIVVATIGEVVLSVGWGLYTYQHALIPLYVPPGHGLLYGLAAVTARNELLQKHADAITRSVLSVGSVIALVTLLMFNDVWGLLWWIGAFALLTRSSNKLLLSSCFVYTILLEWGGTAIGNWRWEPVVPGLGLQSANPPSGVGILYILLDLIVVAIASRAPRLRPLAAEGTS